jgi:hypothetical protein
MRTTMKTYEGALSSRGATGCQIPVERIDGSSIDIVVGLEMHHRLGLASTSKDDSTALVL